MIDFRPVLFLDGILLAVLAAAMAVPAGVVPLKAAGDGAVFIGCACATAAVGAAMILGNLPSQRLRLNTQQSMLLVVSGLVLTGLCAAFPFRFARSHLAFTDAWFEAVSGLTTTGATVITNLDHTSPAVLLWRALLNWMGGIGIIVLAIALLPALKVGGMQIVDSGREPDKQGVLRGRILADGKLLLSGYGFLTVLTGVGMWLAGMGPFDALCHAMSAISTGGFSTSDLSLRHWGAGVQWVALAAMLVGASSLPMAVIALRRRSAMRLVDEQIVPFLATIVGIAVILIVWRGFNGVILSADMIRATLFTTASMITTTGFVVSDYSQWGGGTRVAFFMMAFVGGCLGSAAGGIKIFRWQVLAAAARVHVQQMIYPHRVIPIDFNGRRVTDPVIEAVLAFFAVYVLTYAVHAAVLAALGLDLISALSGSAAALGNVGRGIGDVCGPSGNWHSIPKAAKWVLSFEMILGRLELFPVFILFTPGFWKE